MLYVIVRLANSPCKVGWYADVPCGLDFMFMNDMFISDFGAAYPIIISMIQRVPDHRNARQVRSELKAISTPVCKGRVRRCIINRKKGSQVGSMLRCDCL
jgi:hypothetical protein